MISVIARKSNWKRQSLIWLCILIWIPIRGFSYRIVDVDPQRVSRFDTPGTAHDVVVSGKYAYVADGPSGVQVLDISDPANLRRVGGYDTIGRCVSLRVSTNLVYVAGKQSVAAEIQKQFGEHLLAGSGRVVYAHSRSGADWRFDPDQSG